jgi:hypothetical protein
MEMRVAMFEAMLPQDARKSSRLNVFRRSEAQAKKDEVMKMHPTIEMTDMMRSVASIATSCSIVSVAEAAAATDVVAEG